MISVGLIGFGLAEQRQRCLSVFHNRRWDGDFLTIARLVHERRCGDIVGFADCSRPHACGYPYS